MTTCWQILAVFVVLQYHSSTVTLPVLDYWYHETEVPRFHGNVMVLPNTSLTFLLKTSNYYSTSTVPHFESLVC